MRWLWSTFDCLSEWKRRVVLAAFVVTVGGVVWEANDFFEERGGLAAGAMVGAEFDEFGDRLAVSPESVREARLEPAIRYAAVFDSPVFFVGISFLGALLVGSLFRSIARGMVMLVVLVMALAAVFVIRTSGGVDGEALALVGDWLADHFFSLKQLVLSSISVATALGGGFVLGLLK